MLAEDRVEAAVSRVVAAILEGSKADVESAFHALGQLDGPSVIAEMFLWVEDVTDGVDLDALIAASRLRLPEHTREIVSAIRARDVPALERATSTTELGVVIQDVLAVIVSLKEARSRL